MTIGRYGKFLLGVLGGGALILGALSWSPRQSRLTERPLPLLVTFSIVPPADSKVDTGLECSDATNEANAYAAYVSVRNALAKGQPIETIEYASCFLAGAGAGASHDPQAALVQFTGGIFDSNVLLGYLQMSFEASLSKAVETGQVSHWRSSSLGTAALEAYDRTHDKRFIDLFVSYFDRLLELRDSEFGFYDDFHQKVMQSWGERYDADGDWVSHVTIFSVTMLPATIAARRIRAEPELAQYSEFADKVVQAFENGYHEFDDDLRPVPDSQGFWYWRPLENEFEATNHVHMQGEALLNMFALTGDPIFRDRINDFIRFFETGAKIDENGYVYWNYHPYFQVPKAMKDHNATELSEFVWKAGNTIGFLYHAESDGFKVSQALLEGMTRTISDHVLADNGYALNFYAQGGEERSKSEVKDLEERLHQKASTITRYLVAAAKAPKIREQVREIVATRQDLLGGGWFDNPDAAVGYAYFLDGSR